VALFARTSRAHDPFEVTAVARVNGEALVVETTMARSTALRLTTGTRDARATFAPERFEEYRVALERLAPSLYAITSNERTLGVQSTAARLSDENDVVVQTTFERPSGERLSVRATHLTLLPDGYTSGLTIIPNGPESTRVKVLTSTDPAFEVVMARPTSGRSGSATSEATTWDRFRRFLVLGVQHVLTGYDHLLFLLGVLIACRTVRSMLAVITSFTLAHSLTLALAVLGHVSVPGRVVEPLIAASIVFVGIENVRGQSALGRRVALTFLFGLVHGLGFAYALEELELRGSALPAALVAFNIGVELGQLAVAAMAVPLLSYARTSERGVRGLRIASVLLSLTGAVWLVERLAAEPLVIARNGIWSNNRTTR
jgi:hydrogenase/urease accessory protein HupE